MQTDIREFLVIRREIKTYEQIVKAKSRKRAIENVTPFFNYKKSEFLYSATLVNKTRKGGVR